MKKKFSLKKLIMLSIILLFSYLYAQYNIRSNSLYYAKHTQHSEEVDPEILILIKNWRWIYIPVPKGYYANRNTRKDFFYEYEDTKKRTSETITNYNGYIKEHYQIVSYEFTSYKDASSKDFYLDGGKRVIRIVLRSDSKKTSKKYGFSNQYNIQKEKEIYYKVRQLIKPILDANSKPPLINLQWLFDLKYKDYLN